MAKWNKKDSKLVDLIKRWRVEWAILTTLLALATIVMVVAFFPHVSNLWLSVFVLAGTFTASLTTLADLLVSAEDTSSEDQDKGGIIDNKK